MSRIAKKPVSLPKGVEMRLSDETIEVKGPKGTLSMAAPADVSVAIEEGEVRLTPADANDMRMAATTRTLIANMVEGVSEGFTRKLELVGVGYRAAMAGRDLNLSLGFSHPVVFAPPEGVSIEVPAQNEVLIKGADKQQVGQVAANIRALRPPEPYKGKGVRYAGEQITLKEAKKA